ncbi:MAG: DUF6458 family protein [Streptosporangiaceae bacterium]
MGIGVSLFLITIGAILKFAVDVNVKGVDIETIGLILMIVGGGSFVLSMMMMRRQTRRERSEDRAYDEGPPQI